MAVFLVLLLNPSTGKPIKVWIHKQIAFSPKIEKVESRQRLTQFDWKLVNASGDVVNFSDFKGKKIVVNFWATWCPPCIAEMPSLQLLYDEFSEDVVFLFITSDDQATVNAFMKEHSYELPVFHSISNPPSTLKSNSLPTTYVIDEDGYIMIDKVGAADWHTSQIRVLLGDDKD